MRARHAKHADEVAKGGSGAVQKGALSGARHYRCYVVRQPGGKD